jgi:hypothetical protein
VQHGLEPKPAIKIDGRSAGCRNAGGMGAGPDMENFNRAGRKRDIRGRSLNRRVAKLEEYRRRAGVVNTAMAVRETAAIKFDATRGGRPRKRIGGLVKDLEGCCQLISLFVLGGKEQDGDKVVLVLLDFAFVFDLPLDRLRLRNDGIGQSLDCFGALFVSAAERSRRFL